MQSPWGGCTSSGIHHSLNFFTTPGRACKRPKDSQILEWAGDLLSRFFDNPCVTKLQVGYRSLVTYKYSLSQLKSTWLSVHLASGRCIQHLFGAFGTGSAFGDFPVHSAIRRCAGAFSACIECSLSHLQHGCKSSAHSSSRSPFRLVIPSG